MKIRKATLLDVSGIGYVHYHAWNETYTGLIEQSYLDRRSIDKCTAMAEQYYKHTFVAKDEGKIVGFACYKKADTEIDEDYQEVKAIYVLKAYQKRGLGKNLLKSCMTMFDDSSDIVIWVLDKNQPAIDFYEKQGFEKDGCTKDIKVSNDATLHEVRMRYQKPNKGCSQ